MNPLIRLAITLTVVSTCMHVHAQLPQYTAFERGPLNSLLFCDINRNVPHDTTRRLQAIYLPADFPSAPAGTMKNIYFRIRYAQKDSLPTVFNNFTVKLGNSPRQSFKPVTPNPPYNRDTFIANIPIMLQALTFTITQDSTPYKSSQWIKIPLPASGFYYAKGEPFVVDISYGRPAPLNPVYLRNNSRTGLPTPRMLMNGLDSIGAPVSPDHLPEFGFDYQATDVDGVSNLRSFGLFPNPAPEGHFNVSFEAAQSVKAVNILVSDATGRRVLAQSYANVGSSFFRELAIPSAAAGIYFIELLADGERIVRRVTVQ